MSDNRSKIYAEILSKMIQAETVSEVNQRDKSKFIKFHILLKECFPNLFTQAEVEDFDGSLLIKWTGKSNESPVMFMNHHDVVEASGNWSHQPFSGDIADGKIWGRGTLDTKGGLFAMLQAADELIASGYQPDADIYFETACTEETDGSGADAISSELLRRGLRFRFVLDEGGMIINEPIAGANGQFAMIGVGEKGCADLKFIAHSSGGHASTPPKNTPLVRLGKFMADADNSDIFKAELSPVVIEMLHRIAPTMSGYMKTALMNSRILSPLLKKIMPAISPAAGALIKTTIAFTMSRGSNGHNVIPQEAYVTGNMRYSHHQGGKDSIKAISDFAKKYDIETVIIDPGFESPLSSHTSPEFKLIESTVHETFPGVIPSPYVMTGASDARYMSRISDCCFRFAPFKITKEQMDSVHGIDENLDISTLAPAVDFYKNLIKKV